jgi:hypothetical protein
MTTIRVTIPFINDEGQIVRAGEILEVPDHALDALGAHAEVIDPSIRVETKRLQSTAFVTFCLDHQNTYASGHCQTRNNRRDPLTCCTWWQEHIRKFKSQYLTTKNNPGHTPQQKGAKNDQSRQTQS